MYYENNQEWDNALNFMQQCIVKYPQDIDVYLLTEFMLMNTLVEEHSLSDEQNNRYYSSLVKCFQEGYAKFSENAAFLFYSAYIAALSEWYMDLREQDYIEMAYKAHLLEPDNIIYAWGYEYLSNGKFMKYARQILNDQELMEKIRNMGSLGADIINISLSFTEEELSGKSY